MLALTPHPELVLRPVQFRAIASLIYEIAGIHLHDGKEGLVHSRLAKRLRALDLDNFDAYLSLVSADATGLELAHMVDLLTTNKTSFFRESDHFTFLASDVLPRLAARPGPMRLWSAGCSSGEEPYTIAMVLQETLSPERFHDARVLATDISDRMLTRAREGVYRAEAMDDVPVPLRSRHFVPAAEGLWSVSERTRARVSFAPLNLMGPWPMRGLFDVIFCRNVMIYFDRATQAQLVARFASRLTPGGVLLVGHSESLTGIDHPLRYVRPAVYVR